MTHAALLSAAETLADLLEAENGALAAMDFPRVGCLVGAKSSAVAALSVARAQATVKGPVEPRLRSALVRLEGLTRSNQALLQRAMVAHREVVGAIVTAVRKSTRPAAGRYTARGASTSSTAMPLAMSARV